MEIHKGGVAAYIYTYICLLYFLERTSALLGEANVLALWCVDWLEAFLGLVCDRLIGNEVIQFGAVSKRHWSSIGLSGILLVKRI